VPVPYAEAHIAKEERIVVIVNHDANGSGNGGPRSSAA
jgi:hypothetical protein